MLTSSLDILEKAQLPAPQAKAILKVMELELSAQQQVLATKADLQAVRAELKADMAVLEVKIEAAKAETTRWIMASTGVMLGAFYFFLNYARK